ncbi:MAG: hypothetical protein QW117_01095 [Candidatus Pacearchaeota archaeon]
MEEKTNNFITSIISDFNLRISDIEEKQRLLRDRIILVGKNIIELREEQSKEMTEIKLRLEEIEKSVEKIKSALLTLSNELEKKARKSELEIIKKQIKMFEPLKSKEE